VKRTGMGRLLIFLLLLSRMPATASHAQLYAAVPGPPQQMRICTLLCETLTWAGDHYDAVPDDAKNSRRDKFILKQWGHVFSLDSTLRAEDGKDYDVSWTGVVAPSGDRTDLGHMQFGFTNVDFTATWKPGSASASAAAYLRRIAPIDDSHRSKTHPNILLPPGAAEVYASWPDDVRAILMPGGHPLTHEDAGRPCDDAKEDDRDNTGVYNAGLALEIGKFALRNGELLRGRCWINHSAVLNQNPRAVVLLGIMYLLGWSLPKDGDKACHFFSAEYRSGDPWAAYFLDRCYREGLGGRVNMQFAGQIETSALLSDDALRMFNLIDSDDLEKRRQKELDALASDPAIFGKTCAPVSQTETLKEKEGRGEYASGGTCIDSVNQGLLNQRVKEINDRYNAIQ
jgi:hypothetical protein